jgi:pyridoxamine 5'-phosphate oxidase
MRRGPQPPLDPAVLGEDPVAAFRRWFAEAEAAGTRLPEAMALATATPGGAPSLRWVLLKGVEDAGAFLFFTSEVSRKGRELADNHAAALGFWWEALDRQVRIEGMVSRLEGEESDAYWITRPREAQLAAAVSAQSHPVADRETMERAYEALDRLSPETGIPRPAHWGGYRLVAHAIEFWQGQPHRFHDRVRYDREFTRSPWSVTRLWP